MPKISIQLKESSQPIEHEFTNTYQKGRYTASIVSRTKKHISIRLQIFGGLQKIMANTKQRKSKTFEISVKSKLESLARIWQYIIRTQENLE